MISRRNLHRLKLSAALVGIGFVVGAGYRYLQWVLGVSLDSPALLGAGLTGALIAALLACIELLYLPSRAGERWRRKPLSVLLIARASVASVLIVACLIFGNYFLIVDDFASRYPFSQQMFLDLGVSFAVMLALLFFLQIRQIVGPRVLSDFLLGRYYRPVREKRVFLFLDIADSTTLAQSLGDERTHALISQFFLDIGEPIFEFEGETHRYVGDQVVVTWPYGQALKDARCLQCVREIERELKRRSDQYLDQFGLVPKFRAGLHGGPVVAGECGEEKREIVYFGDTVNTAARVEQLCKAEGYSVLVTEEILRDMILPTDMTAIKLGARQLRGRANETTIHAIDWTDS